MPKLTSLIDLSETDDITVCPADRDRVTICFGKVLGNDGKVLITMPMSRIMELANQLLLLKLQDQAQRMGDGLEKLADVMDRAVDVVNARRLAEAVAASAPEAGPTSAQIVNLFEGRPS